MHLSAGVPLPTIAANTDTSMKYIHEHNLHYRADEPTEILKRSSQQKKVLGSLDLVRFTLTQHINKRKTSKTI